MRSYNGYIKRVSKVYNHVAVRKECSVPMRSLRYGEEYFCENTLPGSALQALDSFLWLLLVVLGV